MVSLTLGEAFQVESLAWEEGPQLGAYSGAAVDKRGAPVVVMGRDSNLVEKIRVFLVSAVSPFHHTCLKLTIIET